MGKLEIQEANRMAVLEQYHIFGTEREAAFDDIAKVLATALSLPIAAVTLLSTTSQWFKAVVGADLTEAPRATSICSVALEHPEPMIICDLALDERFRDFPFIATEPYVRFYAGMRLVSPDGYPLGVLCAYDLKPRPDGLTGAESVILQTLAKHVVGMLEQRRAAALDEASAYHFFVEKRTAYSRFWNHSPNFFLVCDSAGVIQLTNPSFTRALGYDDNNAVQGRNIREFVPEEDLLMVLEAVQKAFDNGSAAIDARLQPSEGENRWVAWSGFTDNGLLYVNGRDISVERAQAASLVKIEASLRQSQKMEAVGQLTGGIAHDFNNMLGGVIGNLDMIGIRLKQNPTANIDSYVAGARKATARATALTHRLLAFSRRQTLDPKPVDVNALIMSMLGLLHTTVGSGIALQTDLDPSAPFALCDANQMENALLNLVLNSRDAMPNGGRITLQSRAQVLTDAQTRHITKDSSLQYVSVSVTDNGVGMPREVQERAMDPFFTTKPLGQGTGLGLSMIYGFVSQSQGHICLESTEGVGTVVTLLLPPGSRQVARPEDSTHSLPSPAAITSRRVLLVEDDVAIRELSSETLRCEGFEVVEAGDAAEGMHAFEKGPHFDVLVTDVGLPNGMNGRQMADALRQSAPSLPVLFITGFAENAVFRQGIPEPGLFLLTKPFLMHALVEKVVEACVAA